MDKHSLENLLSAYNLPLADDGEALSEATDLTPEALTELESLLQLSLLLKQTLIPQPISMAFREDLRQSLLTTALQRHGWRGLLVVQLREHWRLTAATASGVSVAVGALSAVVWYRGRSQS